MYLKHTLQTRAIAIPGYTLYHTMHPDGKTHEETALIIRSSIKHYETYKF